MYFHALRNIAVKLTFATVQSHCVICYVGRRQMKQSWNPDTKVPTTSFDDLFQEEKEEKKAVKKTETQMTESRKNWASMGLDVSAVHSIIISLPGGISGKLLSYPLHPRPRALKL